MCYLSKSKLVFSECNDLYFIAIAFIAFTLHEIKHCPVFLGHPAEQYVYRIIPVNSINQWKSLINSKSVTICMHTL
jgi:hypothetical protein